MARTNLHVTDKVNFKCRGDWVLLRIIQREESEGGVALPQIGDSGKENVVIATGPKVEHLKVGDKVLAVGGLNVNMFQLPRHNDLVVAKEEAVAIILTHKDY